MKKFDKQIYESGLIAQGCWDEMDSYMHAAVEKFGELIVRRCISEVAMMGVAQYENEDIGWTSSGSFLYTINSNDYIKHKRYV